MPRQAEVLHHIPGRVRVHVPLIRGKPGVCSRISEMAATVPGVHCINANPVTGSIVVHYDRHDPEVERRLIATLEDLDSLLPFFDPELAVMEKAEAEMVENSNGLVGQTPRLPKLPAVSHRVNQQVQNATNGNLTLAGLAPVLFASMGYLLLNEKRSPLLLGGLIAMSVHSLAASNGKPSQAQSPSAQGIPSNA